MKVGIGALAVTPAIELLQVVAAEVVVAHIDSVARVSHEVGEDADAAEDGERPLAREGEEWFVITKPLQVCPQRGYEGGLGVIDRDWDGAVDGLAALEGADVFDENEVLLHFYLPLLKGQSLLHCLDSPILLGNPLGVLAALFYTAASQEQERQQCLVAGCGKQFHLGLRLPVIKRSDLLVVLHHLRTNSNHLGTRRTGMDGTQRPPWAPI